MNQEGRITIVLDNRDLLAAVCGPNDRNLRLIENAVGGRIGVRGNEIRLESASDEAIGQFKQILDGLVEAVRDGAQSGENYIQSVLGADKPQAERTALIQIPQGFGRVFPRSRNQAAYIQGMRACDISFCTGPAGTGKTYLAIAEALSLVLSKKMRKLVLTRPVVEAGESLGFLPGDLAQKINPYLRPLYDAMESLIPFETIRKMEDTHTIEIAPLAYMRGRSLNNSIVILDEAQNTTKEQMKMFLTRIGEGSRAIITGDITQIDLPRRVDSGLIHALSILDGKQKVEGLHFTYLHTVDVVRNPLIKKIIQAYESAAENLKGFLEGNPVNVVN
ncbi:phosphate starvation protein PhoH [Spirochaetia bacterium]|nr:phosphate starvation protein PhoH [Spirochaetia bacterium]